MNLTRFWAKLPAIVLSGSALVFSVGCVTPDDGGANNGGDTGQNQTGGNDANGNTNSTGVGNVDTGNGNGNGQSTDGVGNGTDQNGGDIGGGSNSGGNAGGGNGAGADVGNGEFSTPAPNVADARADVLNGSELTSNTPGSIEISVNAAGATTVTADLSAVGGGSNEVLVSDGNGGWTWNGTVTPTTGGEKEITITASNGSGETTTTTTVNVEEVRTLTSGQRVNGTVGRGEYDHYVVDAPVGTAEVDVVMDGTGNADLYVKRDSMASSENSDFYRNSGGSYESVKIYWCSRPPIVAGSLYYVAVKGNADNSDYSLTATVR
jgi:hypothetical protein